MSKRKTKKPDKFKGISGQSTLNGNPISITDSWLKCNFTQYLRIVKLKDDNIELISILTGLEYDYLKKAKITGLESILVASQFINTPPEFGSNPTKIGKYKLPLNRNGEFDIQFESLAQFEDMRVVIQSVKLDENGRFDIHSLTESYAKYCALYLQKIRDGEYDGDKALAMIPEVNLMPAIDVITAGSFFFVRLMRLSIGTQSNSQNSAPIRKKRTGKPSKRNSGRTQR